MVAKSGSATRRVLRRNRKMMHLGSPVYRDASSSPSAAAQRAFQLVTEALGFVSNRVRRETE
jgi:hypothetical protein